MPPIIADLVIAVLILGLTYALSSEGLWGSALMFFNVLFAAVIAFNFYEPLAAMLAGTAGFMAWWADMICLVGLFTVTLVVFRLSTETLAPAMVRFPMALYHPGRLLFGFAGAVLTVAFLLLAFDTAPVHKKVFGVVDYKYAPPFGQGIDHKFLGFFQWTTGAIFARLNADREEPFREYGRSRVFDPKGEWLLNHQEARPFGDESVIPPEAAPAAAGAAGGGAAAGGAAGGGAASGGAREGDPKVIGPGGPGGGVVIPQ